MFWFRFHKYRGIGIGLTTQLQIALTCFHSFEPTLVGLYTTLPAAEAYSMTLFIPNGNGTSPIDYDRLIVFH